MLARAETPDGPEFTASFPRPLHLDDFASDHSASLLTLAAFADRRGDPGGGVAA